MASVSACCYRKFFYEQGQVFCRACEEACEIILAQQAPVDEHEYMAATWADLFQCPQCSDRCVGGFYSQDICAVCGQKTVVPSFTTHDGAAMRLFHEFPNHYALTAYGAVLRERNTFVYEGDPRESITLAAAKLYAKS